MANAVLVNQDDIAVGNSQLFIHITPYHRNGIYTYGWLTMLGKSVNG
jgi:hypothetical protein